MNLRQLARAASLSASAVSLALRDSPKISPATKLRVRQLAEQYNYRPDAKVTEVMRHLRQARGKREQACFGVISFYDDPQPWEKSLHLGRIYTAMQRRAMEVGYRLEPFWLREPGMTYRRLENILTARGIEGLVCFGSPDVEEELPSEFGAHAIVTIGLSIRTKLHRVTAHFYNDTIHALERIHALGYRRPGFVVGQYEEIRSGYAYTSAYLGWCERRLGPGRALPVKVVDRVEPGPLGDWLAEHQPDVLIFVHRYDQTAALRQVLQHQGVAVPTQLGVVVLTQIVSDGFSGLQQNQTLMGAWAIELLAARLTHRDVGIPKNPRIEMVESEWIENGSVRPQARVNS